MRILVLHDHVSDDARPDEADALTQARAITETLERLGHEWMTLGVTLDLEAARTALRQLQPELVFNVVESLGGHGRLIHVLPGLLDAMGIPYTGVSATGQFLTSNKLAAKRLLHAAGVPTPAWWAQGASGCAGPDGDASFEPGRYIMKSVWEHASIGLDEDSVVLAATQDDLQEALSQRCASLGGEGFAERYIDGREFNLGLLARRSRNGGQRGVQVLPPAEIVFDGYAESRVKVVGYRAKWDESSYEYHHTPRRYEFEPEDAALLERLTSLARRCWATFELRGYARVDFRVDDGGEPYVLEVNANPCLSPDAGFAASLACAGIDGEEAIARIMDDALAS